MRNKIHLTKTALLVALFPVLLFSTERVSAFYDPGAQRWLNRDPIMEAGGISLYAFLLNNPVCYVDANGREAGCVYYPDGRMIPPVRCGPPPYNPINVAGGYVGFSDYHIFNPLELSKWFGKPKCNKFVGDCISQCPNRPRPLVNGRYPNVEEWEDPHVNIPGYGPPHGNPRPGDVVVGGGHVGFMGESGYIEASTYGTVKCLPFNNPLWKPGIGRSPLP